MNRRARRSRMNSASRSPPGDQQPQTHASGVGLRLRDDERDTARHGSRNDLVLENVLGFPIQLVRHGIDTSNLVDVGVSLRLAKTAAHRLEDEGSSVTSDAVNSGDEFVWKVKLNGHRRERS